MKLLLLSWLLLLAAGLADARTWSVGPGQELERIADAARRVGDGDTVEVAAGTYRGDVAVWARDRITLRAVGGRVRLVADGAAAEGKAIWVVRGDGVAVQGFDFSGTRVAGRNGAGIRFERGSLLLRDCGFFDNEMGVLTGNDGSAQLTVDGSRFAGNGRADGHNHQLYAGRIARLTVQDSSFTRGAVGHLLKSRAARTVVERSRFDDGPGGHASYELEFPNGGAVEVRDSLVAQVAATENPVLVAYGAEGLAWPENTLLLDGNTLVDGRDGDGVFVRVFDPAVPVHATRNRLVGSGRFELPNPGRRHDNIRTLP